MMPTTSSAPQPVGAADGLPLRAIPGSHGWPVVGPLWDRLCYQWLQGQEMFFKSRVEKYKSTVFRTNVPPCFPFLVGVKSNVIAVLDIKSYSHIFDLDIIEKNNVVGGHYVSSLKFTGGYRVCVYLYPTEEAHAKLKGLAIGVLKRSSTEWSSSLVSSLDKMWNSIDESLSKSGKAKILLPVQKCLFTFLSKSIIGGDPANYSRELDEKGHIMLDKWLAAQILPTTYVDRFQPFTGLLLQSFPFPFWLFNRDYEKLTDFVAQEGKENIQLAQSEFGLTKQETIPNLLFFLGVNSFGGFTKFIPNLINRLGTDTSGFQERLRKEVRQKCGSDPPSYRTVREMPFVEAFVYETLRSEPPVPVQFGRAKKDFLLTSHHAVYQVKKGEVLCGFQKLPMMDPTVFTDPDRFMGQKGRDLLKYLYWSHGPQTTTPSPANKQCPATDFVVFTGCILIAHFFQRYDSFKIDSSGSIVTAEKAK